MLARPVDFRERLLMQQDRKIMVLGYLFHQVHEQLVVIYGKVGLGVDRGALILVRGYLVMPCFQRYSQAVGLILKIFHEMGHPLMDAPEIMIGKLLVLG